MSSERCATKEATETNHHNLLLELASYVVPTEKQKGKLHDVFEPSFDWKECYSDRFIEQKLNYIHENPCRGKWELVKLVCSQVNKILFSWRTGNLSGDKLYGEKDIDLTKCNGK